MKKVLVTRKFCEILTQDAGSATQGLRSRHATVLVEVLNLACLNKVHTLAPPTCPLMLDVHLSQSLHHLPPSGQHLDFLHPPIYPARTPGLPRLPRLVTGHCCPTAPLSGRLKKDFGHRRQLGTLQTSGVCTPKRTTGSRRTEKGEDLEVPVTRPVTHTELAPNKPAGPTSAMSDAHGLCTSHSTPYGGYSSTAAISRNLDAVHHDVNSNAAYSSYQAQSISRFRSCPASPVFYEPVQSNSAYSHNAIASYLQIPSTISTNKGSLAELAAQVGIR